MEAKASLQGLRIAPRKVRLVIDQIRGLGVTEARAQLQFLPKAAARPILKLLDSAIANAEHSFHLDRQNLFIAKIIANEGTVMKRWRARAMGKAAMIRKRSSHVEIVLAAKEQKDVPKENSGRRGS